MAKVTINLERDLYKTDRITYDRYTIYIDGEKYRTGYINPYVWENKKQQYYWPEYMTTEEELNTIKKMYHWLF